jgi:hypothetical protein
VTNFEFGIFFPRLVSLTERDKQRIEYRGIKRGLTIVNNMAVTDLVGESGTESALYVLVECFSRVGDA